MEVIQEKSTNFLHVCQEKLSLPTNEGEPIDLPEGSKNMDYANCDNLNISISEIVNNSGNNRCEEVGTIEAVKDGEEFKPDNQNIINNFNEIKNQIEEPCESLSRNISAVPTNNISNNLSCKQRKLLKKKQRTKELRRLRYQSRDNNDIDEEEIKIQISLIEEENMKVEEMWNKRNQEIENEFNEKKLAIEKELEEKNKIKLEIDDNINKKEAQKKELTDRIGNQQQSEQNNAKIDELRKSDTFGIKADGFNCLYYLKTGVCKYDDKCARFHDKPTKSKGIVIRNMYQGISFTEVLDDAYGTLEYSDVEIFQHFKEFYDDILPELKTFGRIDMLKVSRNPLPHLKGCVWIQYSSESEAERAKSNLQFRYYAGKPLRVELLPPTVFRWQYAICGQFLHQNCIKGSDCHFIHPFEKEKSRSKRHHSRSHSRNRSRGRSRSHSHSSKGSHTKSKHYSRSIPRSRSISLSIERSRSRSRAISRSLSPTQNNDINSNNKNNNNGDNNNNENNNVNININDNTNNISENNSNNNTNNELNNNNNNINNSIDNNNDSQNNHKKFKDKNNHKKDKHKNKTNHHKDSSTHRSHNSKSKSHKRSYSKSTH